MKIHRRRFKLFLITPPHERSADFSPQCAPLSKQTLTLENIHAYSRRSPQFHRPPLSDRRRLGAENFPNSHHYILELQLEGSELDQHGYLVDIVDVEKHLDELVNYYKEQMLNEKPEFAGLNPSIEHFSRILATTLNERIKAKRYPRSRSCSGSMRMRGRRTAFNVEKFERETHAGRPCHIRLAQYPQRRVYV